MDKTAKITLGAGPVLLVALMTSLLVGCSRKGAARDGADAMTATPTAVPTFESTLDPTATPTPQTSSPGAPTGDVVYEPAPKDCTPYDANTLNVASAGASGWYLRYGTKVMMTLDTKTDADDALVVVRRYTQACYVGRGNNRPVRDDFIVRYWEGPSGLPLGNAPSHLDCIAYQPSQLSIGSADGSWWLLHNSDKLLRFDTPNDAMRIRLHANGFKKLCFIGRGNARPVPSRYILEYWLQ